MRQSGGDDTESCCYFIARIKIHDRQEYESYLKGFDRVFENYDGEVVAVDDSPAVLEGSWPYTRCVVIRFSSRAEALRWYQSAEYQELVKHRHKSSEADIILAQGRK